MIINYYQVYTLNEAKDFLCYTHWLAAKKRLERNKLRSVGSSTNNGVRHYANSRHCYLVSGASMIEVARERLLTLIERNQGDTHLAARLRRNILAVDYDMEDLK